MFASRRQFMGTALSGTLGLALSPAFRQLYADEKLKRAEACILVFLDGGPSHIDTFDPKPGAKSAGTFNAIDTAIPGIKFCEHLPKLAQGAKNLAVLRSLHSKEGDHDRASVLLHTGYSPNEVLTYPSLGAMVAHARVQNEANAPAFVGIGNTPGAGFLGTEFSPHIVDDITNPAANVKLPEGTTEERLARRLKALDTFNQAFALRSDKDRVEEFRKVTERADRLRKSPALQPFDPATEKKELLDAYGQAIADGSFARNCLTARRMIEHGSKFVELQLSGWDTHADNFGEVQTLCQQLDAGLSTLLTDLAERGLLEKTLVLCVGEFGRTPQINTEDGRDHWSDVFSALLAGGGLKVGQALGTSDAEGAQPKDSPVTIPDLFATVLTALGIDPTKSYRTPDGRPIKLTNGGQVIKGLL